MNSSGIPQRKQQAERDASSPGPAFKHKAIAVVSGKGGVGKTTTAVNLAVYAARNGLKTGILDLDPLSDIATLLDLVKPESAVKDTESAAEAGITEITVPVFKNLDLLFPLQKTTKASVDRLFDSVYEMYPDEINEKYDLIIFDMPAGSDDTETLRYLPLVGHILLVTNPEPTAHVAAGAFLKKAFTVVPETRILVWHNRYSVDLGSGFDPRDVIGNYNRNIQEDERIRDEQKNLIEDVAFVPPDQSLDLLRGKIDPVLLLQKNMLTLVRSMNDLFFRTKVGKLPFSARIKEVLAYYITRRDLGTDPESAIEGLAGYLLGFMCSLSDRKTAVPFTPEERNVLLRFFSEIMDDGFHRHLNRQMRTLEHSIKAHTEKNKPFSADLDQTHLQKLDRSVPEFLIFLNGKQGLTSSLKNYGSLLLFYFSLYKLFQSRTVFNFIQAFLPLRKDAKGNYLRDRNKQIRSIIEGSGEYRERFISLVKKMYPIVMKQIAAVHSTFALNELVFKDEHGMAGKAYLKLLSGFLHDAVNSGLGIIVGFDYRPAAAGFKEGAEHVLKEVKHRYTVRS